MQEKAKMSVFEYPHVEAGLLMNKDVYKVALDTVHTVQVGNNGVHALPKYLQDLLSVVEQNLMRCIPLQKWDEFFEADS